ALRRRALASRRSLREAFLRRDRSRRRPPHALPRRTRLDARFADHVPDLGAPLPVRGKVQGVKLRPFAIVFLLAAAARADDAPKSTHFGYSAYERETIAMVVKKVSGEVDPAPDGKIIESIQRERL